MLTKKSWRWFYKSLCLLLLWAGLWTAVSAQGIIYLPVVANTQPPALSTPSPPQSDQELAIAKVAAAEAIATVLAGYPKWVADAYPNDEAARIWQVDFYAESDGDYLGHGYINLNLDEVFDVYMPHDLPPAELQAGIAKIDAYLPYDAEVQARLGNPELWYHDVSYNKWDEDWEAYYSRGLDELLITLYLEEDGTVYLDAITDPTLLAAEDAAEERRNRAINLAYRAEGIDAALADVDNWFTYVEDQGNAHYTVAFTTADRTLYRVYVDIDNEQIIEAD